MQFVTDRTETDLAKCFYRYDDLNRVEGNVQTICQLAARIGVNLELTVKTDWGLPGDFDAAAWPTQTQMARYLQNVRDICTALDLEVDLPVSMRYLTASGANNIEIALRQAYEEIQRRMS